MYSINNIGIGIMGNMTAMITTAEDDDSEGKCEPYSYVEAGFESICAYVRNHSEDCEGGGYVPWTQIYFCITTGENSPWISVLILVAASLYFLLLFIHLSIAADSFFSKNIASIVDLHKISQNIAGITFMAFGNGAPDIFTSIASVISAKTARADLAISGLLGGGIFVTTCVIASIAVAGPFLLMRRPILRDIGFYLAALAFLAIISNFDSGQMPAWQPLTFLVLYLVYAGVVISGNLFRQRERKLSEKKRVRRSRLRKALARFMPKKVAPATAAAETTGQMPRPNGEVVLSPAGMAFDPNGRVKTDIGHARQTSSSSSSQSNSSGIVQLPGGIILIPITDNDPIGDNNNGDQQFNPLECIEAGKFFAKEELDAEDLTEETEEMATTPTSSMALASPAAISPRSSSEIDIISASTTSLTERELPSDGESGEFGRFLGQLAPFNWHKFQQSKWPEKIFRILKIPSLLLLRLTVPCASERWSKLIAILHAFMAPLAFCFAFQCKSINIS